MEYRLFETKKVTTFNQDLTADLVPARFDRKTDNPEVRATEDGGLRPEDQKVRTLEGEKTEPKIFDTDYADCTDSISTASGSEFRECLHQPRILTKPYSWIHPMPKPTTTGVWCGMQQATWTGCAQPMPGPVNWVIVKN